MTHVLGPAMPAWQAALAMEAYAGAGNAGEDTQELGYAALLTYIYEA